MKLFKLFLPMLAVAAMAAGCTKEYYTIENYSGVEVYTHQYTITPAQWKRNEGSYMPGSYNYLYADKDIADITADVMKNGSVVAYVYDVYDVANNQGAWNLLPYIIPIEYHEQNEDGTWNDYAVSENIRFEWEEGKVTFIIQELDGWDPSDMKTSITVKVCVIK
ncbi:MAG: hypothetical protein J6X88_05370 [Bacteroidales bacterium]|nr:hypothetical protein [Bacteroidales bacterium]